ncbi:hypothetical protein, partial [Stomatobaculum longum]|uniref:hypothetical protein n=1 Tax=Stomatobaculum longum TaxID=796942 RepID=UPI0028DCDD97
MMMTERQKTAGTSRQNTAGETQDKHFFQRPAACREAESGCRISHNAAEIRQREISGHEIPDLLRYLICTLFTGHESVTVRRVL